MSTSNPPVTPAGPAAALSFAQLVDAWYTHAEAPVAATPLDLADGLLIGGEYGTAVAAYASMTPLSPDIQTRQGFALHLAGQSSEGLPLMDRDICLASPAGKAALADVQYAAYRSHRGFGGIPDEVRALAIDAAFDPVLSPYAVRCFWRFGGLAATSEQRLEVSVRGLAATGEIYLQAWKARALRLLDRQDEIDVQQLAKAASRDELCAMVLLELSIDDGPWETAELAVRCLQDHAGADEHRPYAAALLQAVIDISAARASGDLQRAQRALSFTEHHFDESYVPCARRPDLGPYALEDELCALAVRLEAARLLALDDVASDAAARAGMTYLCYPLYQPSFEMVDLVLAGFRTPWWIKDVIDNPRLNDVLPPDSPWRWMKVVVELEEDAKPHWASLKSFARHIPALDLPDWMQRYVATIQLATGHPKPEVLGVALARWSMHDPEDFEIPDKALNLRPATMRGWVSAAAELIDQLSDDAEVEISPELSSTELIRKLSYVGEASVGVELADAVHSRMGTDTTAFHLAFAAYADKRYDAAARLYRELVEKDPCSFPSTRNLALAYAKAGHSGELQQLLADIGGRAAEANADWPGLRDEIGRLLQGAKQSHTERNKIDLAKTAMRAYNDRLGAITAPGQLTLGQATALLALLRGSDIDHATWEVASLSSSRVPFGPTPRFLGLLQELANLGALGVSSIANRGIHAVGDHIEFDWSDVTFKIVPASLDLQRAIRDLPREQWPTSWSQELETLAISVAVEECMAYIWHLADERSLPLPEDADLRSVYRSHLQRASAGRCWYFTFKTIQSANDYRTRFPAGRPQIAGYILKNLRQVGEKAIEENWTTSYNRLWALPRSHFAGALHDVLTGWGDNAFDSRIRDLVV